MDLGKFPFFLLGGFPLYFKVGIGKGANMEALFMKKHLYPILFHPPPQLRRQDNNVHKMQTIVSHLRGDNIVHFRKWTIFAGSIERLPKSEI